MHWQPSIMNLHSDRSIANQAKDPEITKARGQWQGIHKVPIGEIVARAAQDFTPYTPDTDSAIVALSNFVGFSQYSDLS
jgi:hypothetical protein